MSSTITPLRMSVAAALLGSVSALTLSSAAFAQPAAPPPPVGEEEVLITGTLIRGAAAVGVPVTALDAEAFQEQGALTVSDVLRSVPSITVMAEGFSLATGTGNFTKAAGVNIHDLNGSTPRTLVLFDGYRFPLQGNDNSQTDPSTIPAIMTQRVDVLADGASAIYGSDAVAGVVNVILKRRFEGAVTQARIVHHADMGPDWDASQLYGTRWDTGDITIGLEFYWRAPLLAKNRDFYTFDFTAWGLDDRTPVRSSIPATLFFGGTNPSPQTGSACDADILPDIIAPNTVDASDAIRCYSIPKGQNGTGLTWATIAGHPGVENLVNPYFNSDLTPWQKRSAFAVTFDQMIMPGVELFVDAFYSNRKSRGFVAGGFNTGVNNTFVAVVPTNNPYFPTGPLPTGATGPLRVAYNISAEFPSLFITSVVSKRWNAGFNFELPYDWAGKAFYVVNEEDGFAYQEHNPNFNHLAAALGNTVASLLVGTGPVGPFSKPANIPFFNPFCDSLAFENCNDPRTLEYIRGYRHDNTHWYQRQMGVQFDGGLLALPGGELRAAIGGGFTQDAFDFRRVVSYLQYRTDIPADTPEFRRRDFYSAFGELNIPLVGDANAMPLIQRLTVQASYRWDKYNDFGTTKNPRFAVDWMPFDGVMLRGSYGTSFRAPPFADTAEVQGRSYQQANTPTGGSNSTPACTNGQLGTAATPGSAAALLNPTCTAALQFPGGINAIGGTQILEDALDGLTRPVGFVLGPEKSKTWTTGFSFTPSDGFLSGLDIHMTYYHVVIDDLISGGCTDLNDPRCLDFILVAGKATTWATPDGDNIVSQAEFDAAIAAIGNSAQSQVPPNLVNQVRFLLDGSPRNEGTQTQTGIDFTTAYDYDTDDMGVFNIGLDGNYRIKQETNGDSPLEGTNKNAGIGNSTVPRFRYRGRLGWKHDGWRVTGFVNYTSHFHHTQVAPPSCYISAGTNCPGITPAFPNYGNIHPSVYTMDLSIGYDTGETFENTYLHNIELQLNINNITDRYAPFAYRVAANGGSTAVIGGSPLGRAIAFQITKNW